MVLNCFMDSAGLMVLGNRLYEMTIGQVGKIIIEFLQSRTFTCGPMTL